MQLHTPYPKDIPGDNDDGIMARSGDVVGFTSTRAVWRFGFMPNSDAAKAYGCAVTGKGPLFVLCDKRGKILETFDGWALDLPAHFRAVINGPYTSDDDGQPDEIDEIEAAARALVADNWDRLDDAELQEDGTNRITGGYIKSVYLGSVLSIMPSGKYYTPWANSNVTEDEAELDEHFREALEAAAGERGGWVESGEGDPLDLYLCRHASDEEEAEEIEA